MSAAAAMSSCGSVFDDLDPCPAGVEMRFVYDYNLEGANAFPSQVDCLTLHIYDDRGILVSTITENSEAMLGDESWRLTLDLAPGSYHAVAYGGISCDKASFEHTSTPAASSSHYTDIAMSLKKDHVGTRLHDHFHGALDFSIDPAALTYTAVTMNMTKTTNHLRLLLQQLNGEPVDGNDFEFYITDDHTELDHNNTPVTGHPIKYDAWTKGSISTQDIDYPELDSRSNVTVETGIGGNITVGYGEISTSRLHLSTRPRLIVYSKQAARNIIDIPLNTYLLMGKSDAYNYSNQEYLDRCSNWNLTFFLDSNNLWVDTKIIINGWVVRVNDIQDL